MVLNCYWPANTAAPLMASCLTGDRRPVAQGREVWSACWEVPPVCGWEVVATAGWNCTALGHDEGRRSGGGLEDSRTEKIAEKEKTQVDQILIFLGVEYWVLLEMSFFFFLNIFLGVGKHSVFRWKV